MVPVPDAVRSVAEAYATASTRMLGSIREEFPDLSVTGDVARVPSPAGELAGASFHADLLVVGDLFGSSLGLAPPLRGRAGGPFAYGPCLGLGLLQQGERRFQLGREFRSAVRTRPRVPPGLASRPGGTASGNPGNPPRALLTVSP
jgi:hypothetical protein